MLWEGGGDDPKEIQQRQVVVTHINEIIEQVSLWLEADKLHQQAALDAQDDAA